MSKRRPSWDGIVRKREGSLLEGLIVVGHKPDDHEEPQYGDWNMTMGGM